MFISNGNNPVSDKSIPFVASTPIGKGIPADVENVPNICLTPIFPDEGCNM